VNGEVREEALGGEEFAVFSPFMNWMTQTRKPCPTARRAWPKAAVVFPLPFPV